MRIPSNKISSVIAFFKSELKDIYPSEEINEFIFLSFGSVLKFSKTDLSIKEKETMSESELLKFNNIVKELKKHKPIQYILGNTKFYGLDLVVNESVLIPRPETEELVDTIIKESEVGSHPDSYRESEVNILDIGTGSGCIAIALKKNIPDATVYAVDISEKALETAKQNADLNEVEINFIHADILTLNSSNFQTLKPFNSSNTQTLKPFNIIVSNPPYITHSEKEKMHKNVLDHEPHQALFVDNSDPLVFYRVIAEFALKQLTPNGMLFFEINENHGENVSNLLQQKGFKNISLKKDINAKNRILCCTI